MRCGMLKRKVFGQDKPLLCGLLTIADTSVAKSVAEAGYDCLIIEAQHFAFNFGTLKEMLATINVSPALPLVRVPVGAFWMMGPVLDWGSSGIIAPMIETASEAQQVVKACRFPPLGSRSAGWPGTLKAICSSYEEYVSRANEELLILVQIESSKGVDNIEEILAVEGIDGIMIGPGDLALSLGVSSTGQALDESGLGPLVRKLAKKCRLFDRAFGLFLSGQADLAAEWVNRGARIISMGSDSMFVAKGADSLVKDIQQAMGRETRTKPSGVDVSTK